MPKYRVLCADLVSNTIREELPITRLTYSEILDAPGAFTGSISLDHPKCTRSNLDPGATAIYIERGGLLVWGGILWTARADTLSRRLDLGGEGFWSYFGRRRIRTTKTYTAQDQLAIARDLVNYAQAQPGSLTGITVGTETSGVPRDRTYFGYERKNLGEAINELAAVTNGFDFDIRVAWDATGTIPQRTFRLHYPRRGARIDGLVFNHNMAGIASFQLPVDATMLANVVDVLGQGDADNMLIATAADTSMLSRYPLLETSLSKKDVNVAATLTGHAQAQLARRSLPRELPALTKDASIWPDYGSFQVGDEAYVVASDAWVNVGSWQRIQQLEMRVSDDGQETMAVGLVSADLSAD